MGSCSCPRAAGVSCPPGARVASCSPTVRMRQARQAGGVRTVGEHGAQQVLAAPLGDPPRCRLRGAGSGRCRGRRRHGPAPTGSPRRSRPLRNRRQCRGPGRCRVGRCSRCHGGWRRRPGPAGGRCSRRAALARPGPQNPSRPAVATRHAPRSELGASSLCQLDPVTQGDLTRLLDGGVHAEDDFAVVGEVLNRGAEVGGELPRYPTMALRVLKLTFPLSGSWLVTTQRGTGPTTVSSA